METCDAGPMGDNRGPLREVTCMLPDYVTNVDSSWAPAYFDINKVSHSVELSNKLTHALDNTTFALPNKGDFLKNISAYDPALSPDHNVPTITITAVPVQPDVCLYPEDLDLNSAEVITGFRIEEAEEVRVKVENIPCSPCDASSPGEGLTSPSEQEWAAPSTDSEIDNSNVPTTTEPISNDLGLHTTSPTEEQQQAKVAAFVEASERPYFQNRPTSVYDPRRQRRTRYAPPLALSHSHTFPFAKAQQKAYNTAQAQVWTEYEAKAPADEIPRPPEEKVAPKTEPYIYRHDRESLRRGEVLARVDCILKPLPAPDRLAVLLAESQPKGVAQYTRKDWTEDELMVETPFCGTLSIMSHAGALVWFGVLVWQLKVRDGIEARKWQTVGHGWYRQRVETGEEFDPTLMVIAGCLLGLSYLTILLEGIASYAENYLRNFMSLLEAVDFIRLQRKVVPKIVWTLEHYVTEHTVQTYTRLKDGQTVTSSFGKLPRKVKATFELPIRRCVDVSGDVKAFHPGAVTRVEMDKTFGFINQKSAMQYERLKQEFLAKYPNRPANARLEEKLEIPGFHERITVYFEADGRHQCMRKRYFWLFTFAFLGWPYRWWFRNATEKCRFTLVKLIELSADDNVPP